MTEDLTFIKGPQSPETEEVRRQIVSGELDLGPDFHDAMAQSVDDGDIAVTAK